MGGEGLAIEGLAIEGLAIEGLAIEGLAIDGGDNLGDTHRDFLMTFCYFWYSRCILDVYVYADVVLFEYMRLSAVVDVFWW